MLMSENVLRSTSLFQGLEPEELDMICVMFESISVPKGTRFITQDECSDGLYIIASGQISVLRQLPSDIEVELAELTEGHFVGETALLTYDTAIASTQTITDCECFILNSQQFEALCLTQPKITNKIAKNIAKFDGNRIRYRIDNIIQLWVCS